MRTATTVDSIITVEDLRTLHRQGPATVRAHSPDLHDLDDRLTTFLRRRNPDGTTL